MAGVIVTEIAPPKAHISLLLLFSRGLPHTNTVGAPGTQGAGVTGEQGIGVNAPYAAAVAAATAGFARLEHMPKVAGWLSIIVACGILLTNTVCWLDTRTGQGAAPKEHVQSALFTTGFAKASTLLPFQFLYPCF